MDVVLIIISLLLGLFSVVLFLELKGTQEKVASLKAELERRMLTSVETMVSRTTAHLPKIEQEVAEIRKEVEEAKAEIHELHDLTAKVIAEEQAADAIPGRAAGASAPTAAPSPATAPAASAGQPATGGRDLGVVESAEVMENAIKQLRSEA